MILIVDDSDSDVELLAVALEMSDQELKWKRARDGVEALDYFGQLDVVVPRLIILLDLKMPRLDGFQTLSRLREVEGLRFVPVVVMSSSDEPEDVARAYHCGANSFVQKPVEFDHLSETFARLATYWHQDNIPVSAPQSRATAVWSHRW